MTPHFCELCARGKMHRSERRTLAERFVYPLFGMFPWRCNVCRNRVLLQDRGMRRLYISGEGQRRRSSENDASRDVSHRDAAA